VLCHLTAIYGDSVADTVKTEDELLAAFGAEKVFHEEVPMRAKRVGQIIAQDMRDFIVSMRSAEVVPKSGTYTATTDDDTIIATANTFTVTLYTAVGNSGRKLRVKNAGTGAVTVDGAGTETIDGALTQVIAIQYDAIHIISDGTNWHII